MLEEKRNSYIEICESFPEAYSNDFKDLFESWLNGSEADFLVFIEKLKNENVLQNFSDVQLRGIDSILSFFILNNQTRIWPESYPVHLIRLHNHLLDIVGIYIVACESKNMIPSKRLIETLFNGISRFYITGVHDFYHEQEKLVLLYFLTLKQIVDSEVFPIFLKNECNIEYNSDGNIKSCTGFNIQKLVQDLISDLIGFLHTRRSTLFLETLKLILSIFRRAFFISGELKLLPEILTWGRRLLDFGEYTFQYFGLAKADGISHVEATLLDLESELPQGWGKSLLNAWQYGATNDGSADMLEIVLNIDWVYMELLKEIAGDGIFTDEEEEVIRHMRSCLEISDERYQQILNHVTQLPVTLNRDFDPCIFFWKITQVAMADGVLETSEKELLVKTANALSIEKDVVREIFRQVVQGPDKDNEYAQNCRHFNIDKKLEKSWINSMKLRKSLLTTNEGEEVCQHVKNLSE